LQLIDRPAFNVGYVGINQTFAPLDDIVVRQAIAYGLDRQSVIDNLYAGRGEVAQQFQPPSLFGYAPEVTTYEFDPAQAQQILTDAGYELPIPIEFWYPADVSRPYMPDPQRIAEAFASNLGEAGFEVELVSAPWSPDYLDAALNGQAAVYLLGQTGDFGDPDTFLGTFFREPRPQWGEFDNPEIYQLLQDALVTTDQAERTALYEQANQVVMDYLPGIPFAHNSPALAFRAGISGFVPSPATLEQFAPVTLPQE
jgi:peptide/nickel transport system substrate-binding protein